MLDELSVANEHVQEVVPTVVSRHRFAGVLTWALLHEIEGEVLAELIAEVITTHTFSECCVLPKRWDIQPMSVELHSPGMVRYL